mgnify:FL=1
MGNIRGGTLGFHGTIGQPTAQVIDGSLKFNGVNQHLTKTFSSSDDRRTFTVSYWIKESGKGSSPTNNPHIFAATPSENTRGGIVHRGTGSDANEIYLYNQKSNTTGCQVWTNSLHRDFSGWKHIVWVVDTTQATGTNRVKFYINGVQETLNFATTPAQNYEMEINDNNEHRIGRGYPNDYGNYYLSQLYSVPGQTLGPENFGFTDPQTNTWRPKKYTGTFGTNGFYLPLDNQDDFEVDKSGNGNDFSKNNFSGTFNDPNVLKDSPSGAVFGGRAQTGITTTSSAPANYATLNPLSTGTNVTLSDGNLKFTNGSTEWNNVRGTIFVESGKYYCETVVTQASANNLGWGVVQSDHATDTYIGNTSTEGKRGWALYGSDGSSYTYYDAGNNNASYTLADNDVLSMALDMDNGTIRWYRNGALMVPTSGSNIDNVTGSVTFACTAYASGNTSTFNFGQKPFKYAPPQGYLPLNSASARPNKVVPRPDQYVGISTWTGDGNTGRNIKTLQFKPDLVWIKQRDESRAHAWFDSVRGANKRLQSSTTNAETTHTDQMSAFIDNGFTVEDNNTVNVASGTYVGWSWRAGGSKNTFNVDDVGYASAAAAGLGASGNSWDSDPTGASIGTKQGFSIIKHTGTGSTGTLPHGLTQKPTFYISKPVSTTGNWVVYTDVIDGSLDYFYLNTTGAKGDSGQSVPTSEVFSYGYTANEYIHYLWHDVPGLQKFGSYKGNQSADGTYVELGFRPSVIIIKSSSHAVDWVIFDVERGLHNPISNTLYPNLNGAEYGVNVMIDVLSNGFKLRNTYTNINDSSYDYIYAAWAEAPASNLFGGQSNAR